MTSGADTNRAREVRMPTAGLAAIRRAVQKAGDPDSAARALQRAGVELGRAMYADLAAEEDPATLPAGSFWDTALGALSHRGWGTYTYRARHPGVGELATPDGPEVEGRGNRPDCFLTAGMIAGLLAGVDVGPVAVLEVACRSQGDAECRFLFGGREAIAGVHAALSRGEALDAAVGALG